MQFVFAKNKKGDGVSPNTPSPSFDMDAPCCSYTEKPFDVSGWDNIFQKIKNCLRDQPVTFIRAPALPPPPSGIRPAGKTLKPSSLLRAVRNSVLLRRIAYDQLPLAVWVIWSSVLRRGARNVICRGWSCVMQTTGDTYPQSCLFPKRVLRGERARVFGDFGGLGHHF